MKRIAIVVLLALSLGVRAQERVFMPSGMFKFAERDTCSLWLDIYDPAPGSATSIDGKEKPTVLFVFGGGFIGGERDGRFQRQWFKQLTDEGFHVVAIDYRLGLKGFRGKPVSLDFLHALQHAIDIAVDDLYSATLWLLENGMQYGVDANNMVISGSSAGAITVLQGEYEIASKSKRSAVLPEGFNYAGVISFSGALYSLTGRPWYRMEPCPTLLFHGTEDRIVPYNRVKLGRTYFGGAKSLCKLYKKKGYNYNAYHYTGHGHEIASNMIHNFHEEMSFIETNVMKRQKRIVDTPVDDPGIPIPDWAKVDFRALY